MCHLASFLVNYAVIGHGLTHVHGYFLCVPTFCRYDKGGHLFLPSYIMRIHGARKQREAIKRVPRNQLQPVFEVL